MGQLGNLRAHLSSDKVRFLIFPGGDEMDEGTTAEVATAPVEIIQTYHGSFHFIMSVTLGESLIALAVFLLLGFLVLKWLLETVWRGGRR